MDIAHGSHIDIEGQRYLVQARLGSGSQGQVYQGKAEDGSLVALKFITDPRRRHREADILRGWSSEHVVGLKGQGVHDDGEVLVMDLVDGLTLQRLQEICARLERGIHPALALELIAHVASGLEEGYRTTRLKVHRDIKPSNVMLGRDGFGKVLDFGIAYGLDLTCTGTPVATPLYMAPEQMEGARPAEELDHQTDQYSLGLLLAELVLGRPLRPMERDALARWLFMPGAELDAAREQIGRQAPEILTPLVRMLAWEPEGRFDSMAEVVEALEEARSRCAAPDTLAGFAGRLMSLRDKGQLLDPSDPGLRPLVSGVPATSETILPDMTGEGLPKRPTHVSPMLERTGPMNLADLRILGTAPDGVRGLVGEVKVAGPVDASLEPKPTTATAGALTATMDWYSRQRRRRVTALGTIFAMVILGAGAAYLTYGQGASGLAEVDVKGEGAVAVAPEQATVVARERVVKPKLIPPMRREKADDKSAKQASKVAPSAKETEAVVASAAARKNETKSKTPAAPVETPDAVAAVDPHWRTSVQVMAFEGDVAESMPAPVITDRRPGKELVDDGVDEALAAVVPAAELEEKADVQPAPAREARAEAVELDGPMAEADESVEAAEAAEVPAEASGPIAEAEELIEVDAPPSEAEELIEVDAPPSEAEETAHVAAPTDEMKRAEVKARVDAAQHAAVPPSPIEEAAALAAGYPIESSFEREAAQLVAMAPVASEAPSRAEEAAASEEPAGPVVVATVDTVSLPQRPSSFSDRRWARQLVALGFAARHAGRESQALAYFNAAHEADPQWEVVEKILSGDLDHLPPEPEAADPASSPSNSTEGSGS